MKQASDFLAVHTNGRGLIEITRQVRSWVNGQSFVTGLVTVFCTHTSGGPKINIL